MNTRNFRPHSSPRRPTSSSQMRSVSDPPYPSMAAPQRHQRSFAKLDGRQAPLPHIYSPRSSASETIESIETMSTDEDEASSSSTPSQRERQERLATLFPQWQPDSSLSVGTYHSDPTQSQSNQSTTSLAGYDSTAAASSLDAPSSSKRSRPRVTFASPSPQCHSVHASTESSVSTAMPFADSLPRGDSKPARPSILAGLTREKSSNGSSSSSSKKTAQKEVDGCFLTLKMEWPLST